WSMHTSIYVTRTSYTVVAGEPGSTGMTIAVGLLVCVRRPRGPEFIRRCARTALDQVQPGKKCCVTECLLRMYVHVRGWLRVIRTCIKHKLPSTIYVTTSMSGASPRP